MTGQGMGIPMYRQPQQPMAFPYGFYPPPYHAPHTWYPPNQPPPNLDHAVHPPVIHTGNPPQPVPAKVEIPKIRPWLKYCNKHPDCRGEDFSEHAGKFNEQGYRQINQLSGDQMSMEKLSSWLNIRKGTADLLIQYVEEDMMLLKARNLSMELTDSLDYWHRAWGIHIDLELVHARYCWLLS